MEAWRTVPFQSAYGASKHGLSGFVQALRVELQEKRIPVCVTEVMPSAINTPFYNKVRTKMGVKPRPVPPIYPPSVPAEAILYAAEHPIRSIVAGGAGRAVVLSQRLSPKLSDFVTRHVAFTWQHSDEPKPQNDADSLFSPWPAMTRWKAIFTEEARRGSAYTWLKTHLTAQRILAVIAVAGGSMALRPFRKTAV